MPKNILLKIILPFLLLSLSLFSVAAKRTRIIAEAILVRGKVTALEVGEHKAFIVKKGRKLRQDASILTGKKSFIRIKFLDGSIASLGPESKMIVNKIGKSKVGIISLLKGKLRTKIKNKKNEKEKGFFIKTRTAALGVRGTEFQTLYNPLNKVTSLLTYEGKVQMVKIEKKKRGVTIKVRPKTDREFLEQQQKEMDDLLQSKKSVGVEKGQYSGTSHKVQKISLPIKISPVQFTALYKNNELEESKNIEEKVDRNGVLEEQVEQKVPLEGYRNSKTGDFAARAGGYIDFNSGLYIPPSLGSKFNERLGVYEDKKIGEVNLKTGSYIPPKGLRLDSKKGFVLDESVVNKTDIPSVRRDLEFLNRSMDIQSPLLKDSLPLKKKKGIKKEKKEVYYFNDEQMIKSNIFRVRFSNGGETLEFNGTSVSETKKIEASWKKVTFSILHGGHKRFQMLTSFSLGLWNPDSSWSSEEDRFTGFKFGARFKLNQLGKFVYSTWTVGFNQKHFLFTSTDYPVSNNSIYLKRIFVPQIEGDTLFRFWERKRIVLGVKGIVKYLFHSRTDSGLSARGGLGIGGKFLATYGIIPGKAWMEGELEMAHESQKVDGPKEQFTQGRSSFGMGIKFSYIF